MPLVIRGPGIPKGVSVDEIAINADLAPTILDAANAEAGFGMDGRSLLPFAEHPERLHGRELLIEQQSGDDDEEANGVFYGAVRNSRYAYVLNASGETELYDLRADPYQLENQVSNPAYDEAEAALAARLAALQTCAAKSCRAKPALSLKLPASERENGRSCRSAADFVARVRGAGASKVERVTFRVGSRLAGRDSSTPLDERIEPGLLRGKRTPELRAIVEMIDGRKLSLQKEVRICG